MDVFSRSCPPANSSEPYGPLIASARRREGAKRLLDRAKRHEPQMLSALPPSLLGQRTVASVRSSRSVAAIEMLPAAVKSIGQGGPQDQTSKEDIGMFSELRFQVPGAAELDHAVAAIAQCPAQLPIVHGLRRRFVG